MKKYSFLLLVLLLSACSIEKGGKGLQNAKQFAKEKVAEVAPTLVSEIDRIELVEIDTVISSLPLMIESTGANAKAYDYRQGKCTKEEAEKIRESAIGFYWDILGSLMYHSDKLHEEKYKNWLRLKYNLDIVMKSGDRKNVDVIMEEDGVTPSCLGSEMVKEIKDCYEIIPLL